MLERIRLVEYKLDWSEKGNDEQRSKINEQNEPVGYL